MMPGSTSASLRDISVPKTRTDMDLIMDILKKDFADHQIIIASIFEYNFDKVNYIEIRERLIEANM